MKILCFLLLQGLAVFLFGFGLVNAAPAPQFITSGQPTLLAQPQYSTIAHAPIATIAQPQYSTIAHAPIAVAQPQYAISHAPVAVAQPARIAIAAPQVQVHHAPVAVHHAPVAIAHAPVAVASAAPAEEYDPHPQYSFSYSVNDPTTGDSKQQSESRDGDNVQGSYSLVEPDGTTRTVDYTADPVNGFNAVVHKEGTAHAAPVAVAHAAPIAVAHAPVAVAHAPVAVAHAPVAIAQPTVTIAQRPITYARPIATVAHAISQPALVSTSFASPSISYSLQH
ncbi:unnamed protein product [Nesidiocoris tenuis]|uniref:Cuticle protein n=1 Tax=Nesidiocoris tenuis TaxID=355587 RepID=A0A6H5HR41_9HEMI|nr:unnamed protein product [Nesidiocoris tenuis]